MEHGGKREGAGRPSMGRRRQTLYLTDKEFKKIKTYLFKIRLKKKKEREKECLELKKNFC